LGKLFLVVVDVVGVVFVFGWVNYSWLLLMLLVLFSLFVVFIRVISIYLL